MDGTIVHFVFVALLFSDFYKYGVGQPRMSILSSPVVLGSTAPVSTTFTCELDSGTTVVTIFSMQILRMRDWFDTQFVPVVQAISSGVSFMNGAPADMVQRGTPGGGLDSTTYTNSTLTLTLPTEEILCSDKGTYQCKLLYMDSESKVVTLVNNAALDIYALPHDVNLTARVNNVVVQGTLTNPLDVNVNDAVEFTCTAEIDSDNSTLIKWKRTSHLATTNTFIKFNPDAGTFSDGTASVDTTDCSYYRTATMTYNVTSVETSRQNDLAFQCYVEVTVNNVVYTTQNPPEFYINPVTYEVTTHSVATRIMPVRSFFLLLITCCVLLNGSQRL